jgi:hypothetical protein
LPILAYKRCIVAKKEFIKDAIKRPGALRKAMGAKEGEPISKTKLEKTKQKLQKEAEGDKKLTGPRRRLLRQITLAQTLEKVRG